MKTKILVSGLFLFILGISSLFAQTDDEKRKMEENYAGKEKGEQIKPFSLLSEEAQWVIIDNVLNFNFKEYNYNALPKSELTKFRNDLREQFIAFKVKTNSIKHTKESKDVILSDKEKIALERKFEQQYQEGYKEITKRLIAKYDIKKKA